MNIEEKEKIKHVISILNTLVVDTENDKIDIESLINFLKPRGNENKEPPFLDSKGLPWDKRINATTRKVNQDGTWAISRRLKLFGKDQASWQEYVKNMQEYLLKCVERGNIPAP